MLEKEVITKEILKKWSRGSEEKQKNKMSQKAIYISQKRVESCQKIWVLEKTKTKRGGDSF